MWINSFIYFYIGVCCLLIIFEISWARYMKIRAIKIRRKSLKFKKQIKAEIRNIKITDKIEKEYLDKLNKDLKNITNLIAFDNAYDELFKENYIELDMYIKNIFFVLFKVSKYYSNKNNEMNMAYCAYLIGKYFERIEDTYISSRLMNVLYKMLNSDYIYCKVNSFESICKIGKTENILRGLSILNRKPYTYNQGLLVNQLKKIKNDKQELAERLFARISLYNKNIQISIIKFLSDFPYVDEKLILQKLKDSNVGIDVRCEIMRYFQKNKNEEAKQFLMECLNPETVVANDLTIKAIGTLGYYEEDDVKQLLYKLMQTKDGPIKESAHRSLEKREKIYKEQLLEIV